MSHNRIASPSRGEAFQNLESAFKFPTKYNPWPTKVVSLPQLRVFVRNFDTTIRYVQVLARFETSQDQNLLHETTRLQCQPKKHIHMCIYIYCILYVWVGLSRISPFSWVFQTLSHSHSKRWHTLSSHRGLGTVLPFFWSHDFLGIACLEDHPV